jgi:hypothetical protein
MNFKVEERKEKKEKKAALAKIYLKKPNTCCQKRKRTPHEI